MTSPWETDRRAKLLDAVQGDVESSAGQIEIDVW